MDFVPLNKVKGEGTRRRSRRVGGSAEPVDPLLAREASLVGTTAPYLPPPLRYGGRDLPPSPPAQGDKATAAGTFPPRLRLKGTKPRRQGPSPLASGSRGQSHGGRDLPPSPPAQGDKATAAGTFPLRLRLRGTRADLLRPFGPRPLPAFGGTPPFHCRSTGEKSGLRTGTLLVWPNSTSTP